MIVITLPDGTKISGKKEEVLDAYERIKQMQMPQIISTPPLPDDYPMPKVPWDPKVVWSLY